MRISYLRARRLSAAAVVDESVGGAAARAADGSVGEGLDAVASLAGLDTLESDEVGTKTTDVRGSHRGAGHGGGSTAGAGRDDVLTRSIDIDCG